MAIIGRTQTTGTDGNLLKRFKKKVESFLGIKEDIREELPLVKITSKEKLFRSPNRSLSKRNRIRFSCGESGTRLLHTAGE